MDEKKPLLSVKDIVKCFPGVKALDHVEMELYAGEVLACIGENGAGKSTLMKIILGDYAYDAGSMEFKGKPYKPKSSAYALDKGISMIHQEICLVPTMSVAENIWIGRENLFKTMGLLDEGKRRKATVKLLEEWGICLDPDAEAGGLSISYMQLAEIARALSYNPDVIIMDEPTSSLTKQEIDNLFAIIRKLTNAGKGIIFISHKLEELFEICDRVVVFRDGRYIGKRKMQDITKNELIRMMVGRELKDMYPKMPVKIGDTVLRVENMSRRGYFENISFAIKQGEILGFCGLMGAGRTEVMQSVFGIDKPDSGDVYLHDRRIDTSSTKKSIRSKLAMVTEDRLRKGIMHKLSIQFNISISNLDKISTLGFIDRNKEGKLIEETMEMLKIKASSPEQEVGMLSGGNQQKVIIGKWLLTEPEVLILDEPTRGIDVGAKAEIYKLIGNLVQQGKAIIIVSSELPELIGICDRILVVRNGKIVGESIRKDFEQEKLMKAAFGV